MENGFSKDCIISSLALLLQQKRYAEITMNNISEKSGVSRRTIYRYFDNKDAILFEYVDSLISNYMSYVKNKITKNDDAVLRSLEFVQANFEFFKHAKTDILPINIIDILKQAIAEVIKRSKPEYFSSQSKDYINNYISFVANGCWGIICIWIESNIALTPQEIYTSYKQIVKDLYTRLA